MAVIVITWGSLISWQTAVLTGKVMEKWARTEIANSLVRLLIMIGSVLVLGTRFELWLRTTFLLGVISLGLIRGARAVSKARR